MKTAIPLQTFTKMLGEQRVMDIIKRGRQYKWDKRELYQELCRNLNAHECRLYILGETGGEFYDVELKYQTMYPTS